MSAAPSAVASRTGEISTGRCAASASACTNVGLSVMPPSTRSAGIAMPASASAASTRSAPRCAMPSSTARTTCGPARPAGEPEQRAARAVVPCGRAEAEQRGHEHDAAAVGARTPRSRATRRGDAMRPRSSRSHCTFVPGREHDRFDAPRRVRRRGATRRSGTCRAVPRSVNGGGVVAEREVEHAAGAERDLGVAVVHAALTDERRLLVAEQRGDRRRAGQARSRRRRRRRVDDRAAASRAGMPQRARGRARPTADVVARLGCR